MSLWLYLDFPRLQLDSLYLADDQPVAVVSGRDNRLLQLSQAAGTAGLKPGMGLGTAASLCRQLQVVAHNPQRESERLRELAEWLYTVTADIALDSRCGLWLKVSPMLTLHGSLAGYWQALSQRLAEQGVVYRYGTGTTPLAATLLARALGDCLLDDPRALREHCAACALAHTELLTAAQDSLRRVGIRQLGELLAIPLKAMTRRFPAEVVQYVGRLTGQLPHPLHNHHPAGHFVQSLELLYEIEQVAVLQQPLARLLQGLETFLQQRDQAATEIQLQLHLRSGEPLPVRVAAAQGEYRARRWQQLAALTLERLQLPAPVCALTLSAPRAVSRQSEAGDLLAGRRGRLTPAELLSVLRARLGEEQVGGVALRDDHRPEVAAAESPALATDQPASKSGAKDNALRPLFLLDPPQPLQDMVDLLQGPERITTGWWDNGPVTRDYYIARTLQGGRWYWVFRDLQAGAEQPQWFLHGYFS